MKHFNKLKLNALSKQQLKNRELSQIKGGGCTCSCYYANSGGSSSDDNSNANYGLGSGNGGYTHLMTVINILALPVAVKLHLVLHVMKVNNFSNSAWRNYAPCRVRNNNC